MRAALVGSALAALLLLTGCTDDPEGQLMDKRQEQDALLRERPSSEDAEARMAQARDAVREALAAELGLTAWTDMDDRDRAGCDGDLADSSGRTVFVSGLLLKGGVPDADWPRAVEVVQQAAGTYGFTELDIVVDNPGQHELVMLGEHGALLRFGTIRDATLSLQTGCHLPENAA